MSPVRDSDHRSRNALANAFIASWLPKLLPRSQADKLSAVEVQDHREIYVFMLQLNIGNIRSPDLIQARDLGTFQKVWINWQAMTGIGSNRLELLLEAQQVILSHQPKHAFVVDRVATIMEFRCYPPLTIARKIQRNLLDLVLEIHIFAILRYVHLRLSHPFVVAAAAHFERLTGLGYR